MRYLTDYYLLKMLRPSKSHRFDCIASTGKYEPFQAIAAKSKAGNFYCYLNGVPDTFSDRARQRAPMAITNGNNISSIVTPAGKLFQGYGDTKGTNDALLFQFNRGFTKMEIFVARGLKANSAGLYGMFAGGKLIGEMEALRRAAKEAQIGGSGEPQGGNNNSGAATA